MQQWSCHISQLRAGDGFEGLQNVSLELIWEYQFVGSGLAAEMQCAFRLCGFICASQRGKGGSSWLRSELMNQENRSDLSHDSSVTHDSLSFLFHTLRAGWPNPASAARSGAELHALRTCLGAEDSSERLDSGDSAWGEDSSTL